MEYQILYPERRFVSGAWIVSQAQDCLANAYLKLNPHAEWAAVEENARIRHDAIAEAMDILSDAGEVTFTKTARESAGFTS